MKSLRLEHFWKILWLKKINNGNKKVEHPHNMELAKSALSTKKKALKKFQWSMKSPRLEHFWKIFWLKKINNGNKKVNLLRKIKWY